MGEARRRRQTEERAKKYVRPMKRARFNIFTMGTRLSPTVYMSEEVSWWSSLEEDLLGLVARDTNDNDFLWIILARDRIGKFRCAKLEIDFKTQEYAERQLWMAMAEVIKGGEVKDFGQQGDETNSPLDPFDVPADLPEEKLHPVFKNLMDEPGRVPARKVITELALCLAPKDPHFVREFQTNGFDQRLWEMFLWSAFREFNLDIDQLDSPDFRCSAPGVEFTVEATTVAPSKDGPLQEYPDIRIVEQREKFFLDYMPMKFGSALTSKLNKLNATGHRYWEREESRDKPFVIAIADFHKPADIDQLKFGSMIYTQTALWQYLYGSRVTWRFEGEQLIIDTNPVNEHEYKGKTVPSGFFDLPDAENVSAVIFSNAGTIAKFDRMGVVAGFATDGYLYYRTGLQYNPDPNATMGIPFSVDVGIESYEEYWTQEIQVFHNPKAKHPLPFEWLVGAIHHYFEDGQFKSVTPEDSVLSSITMIVKIVDGDRKETSN